MSGGKEKNKTNAMLDSQNSEARAYRDQQNAQNQARGDTSYGRNTQTYNDIYGGMNRFASGDVGREYKGVSPLTWTPLAGMVRPSSNASGGGGGGYDSPDFGETENFYRNSMGITGGLDAARVAGMDKALGGMQTIGEFGAGSAEDAARLRGSGVYDEMAKTGGLSEAERSNMRNRATNTNQALYAGMRDDLSRQSNASGGGGPAVAAAMSRMARQGSQSVGRTGMEADLGIADQVRQGRLAGASGLTSTENQITQNRLGAQGSYLAGQGELAGSIRSGQQYGAGNLDRIAGERAAAANANAARQAADDRYWAQQEYGNRMYNSEGAYGNQRYNAEAGAGNERERLAYTQYGLGGLGELRGQETGQENRYAGNQFGNQGQFLDNSGRIIDQRMRNNQGGNWTGGMGNLLQGAGSVLGGIMPGSNAANSNKWDSYNFNDPDDSGPNSGYGAWGGW